ncbi:MAG: hypothetical protein WBD00_01830 [Candidatus Omnitrophota bacterium]
MIKVIAVLLSLLMLWQGVVWASPDIFRRNDLQPRTLISDPSGAHAAAVAYLTGLLARYESDPDNRNLFRIEPCVEQAITELKASDKFLDNLPVIKGSPESGEIIINLGPCAIRYYNHKLPGNSDPKEGYRIVEEKRIGDYLSRQIIARKGQQDRAEEYKDTATEEKLQPEKKSDTIPSQPKESKEKDLPEDSGFSSLSFIGEKLRITYSPFFHAPILEELFKVGIPVVALTILNKLEYSTPFLHSGVFYGLLIVLGTIFTLAHIFNKNRDEKNIPDMKDLLKIFTAPVLTAAGGVVLAILFAGVPSYAVLLSMGWHLLVNITVYKIRKYGIDAGYASFEGSGEKQAIKEAALDMASKASLIIREYDSIKRALFDEFGIDLQSDEYAHIRVEVALLSAVQAPKKTMAGFKIFNLDSARYADEIKTVALTCSTSLPDSVAKDFENLGFDPVRDEDVILEIAEDCAELDGENTARYFRNFGLRDKQHVINVANLCARQNGLGTAVYFKEFGLDPTKGEEEATVVTGIALLAAEESASGVATNFKNFGFDPQYHIASIFLVAMACASNSGRATALNFRRFGLKDREDIRIIAHTCAQEDLDGTLLYFKSFGLGMDNDEAVEFCRKAEREFIAESASKFPGVPVYHSLGENGEMFLSMVDDVYDDLDLSGLSVGAQAYVKLLLIEEITSKECISDDFTKRMNEEVIPALTVLETLTMDYPTLGLDYYRPSEELLMDDGQDFRFRAKVMNYISRTKTPHELDRSNSRQSGERFIRVPPAPYPILWLLAAKLENLGIADMRDFNITAAGDQMQEALFLFSILYFGSSRPSSLTYSKEVPGKPWIRGGRRGLSIDPWTGKFLNENDPKTKGMQTQFFLVGSNALLKRKLAMTFALVSASSAYKGAYGLEDDGLKKIYSDLKEDIKTFYAERLGIGKANAERLNDIELRELINSYDFNTGLASAALGAIDVRLRDDPNDDDVQRVAKGRLHYEFKELVDGYIDRIMAHMYEGPMAELLDKGLSGDFRDMKQSVLSMCFSDPETTSKALQIAERAYPVEYGKIQEVGKKVKGTRPSGIKGILKNVGEVIGKLVNSLFGFSGKGKKVLIALDLEIGEGEINVLLRDIVEVLPSLEGNNEDLKRFFKDLEIIKGEGRVLAQRVANLTDPDRGSVDPENLIVVTKKDNMSFYSGFEGRATIAGVNDAGFPKTAYLPLLEVVLFAIGKHLGWDRGTLIKYYETIPNVISYEKLAAEDRGMLFGKERASLVIRLIPDAGQFATQELRTIMDNIRTMLARA